MPAAALLIALSLSSATPATASRGMVIAPAPNQETIVVRRTDDGTLESACVDNDEAAKAFLTGARMKVKKREAK